MAQTNKTYAGWKGFLTVITDICTAVGTVIIILFFVTFVISMINALLGLIS